MKIKTGYFKSSFLIRKKYKSLSTVILNISKNQCLDSFGAGIAKLFFIEGENKA